MSLLRSRYLAFLSAVLCFVAFGCGSGNLSNNLQISISGNAIIPGSTAQLHAQRGNSDGTTVDVTSSVKWTSSQPGVATVSASGLVSALATGTTSITGTVDSATGSVPVAVGLPAVSSLTLTPPNTSVPVGFTQQFDAMASYSNSTQSDVSSSVQWSVAPASAGTINATGLFTAQVAGPFTISAATGGVTASITGTATTAVLSTLAVTPAGASVVEGATQQYTATANFSDNSSRNVSTSSTWSSSNTALLQLSSTGLATAQTNVTAGAVTVFAQVGSTIASAQANVVAAKAAAGPALTALSVTPTSSSVAQHTGMQLRATGYYADGSQQDITDAVTWTTNNANVSSVSSTGLVTTGSPGASTIQASITPTASSRRLRGHAATLLQGQSVSLVTSATLVSVVADSSAGSAAVYTLPIGASQQLSLTGLFSDGTTQDLTGLAKWQSQNPAIATVNAQGAATAVAPGSVTFTGSFGGQTGTTPALTVTNATLLYASLTALTADVIKGFSTPLSLTGHFSDGSTQDLTNVATFQSSNPAVISVDALGNALGISPGNAVLSATALGVTGTFGMVDSNGSLRAIAITPATRTFAQGTTQAFQALGTFSTGGVADLSAEVVWGSTSPAVFTVDANGIAKAGSVGSASVTASLLGISAVSGTVQVSNATLTGMVVDPSYIQAPTGGLGQYRAVGIFSDGTTQDVSTNALWTSSNPAILAINPNGFANALNPGNFIVTATLLGQSASTQQNRVVAATLQSVAIIPATPTIAVNTSEQLGLVGTYSNGTVLDLTSCAQWTSSAPNQAFVNAPGLIVAITAGTSTITATCGASSISTTVVTAPKTLTSIAIQPAEAQESVGTATNFLLIGTFSDGSTQQIYQNVVWGSSSPVIGTVAGPYASSVVGVSPGNTTVSSTYGTLTAPPVVLHVTAKPLASLLVTPANPTLAASGTQQFTAQATYTDNTNGDISGEVQWTSSNPALISIDASGLATTHPSPSGGSATLTATSGAFTSSATVQVQADVTDTLTSLTVKPTSSRIAAGTPIQLTALGNYADGTTRDISSSVTWNSSNPSLATINSTGLATGVAPGMATMLAESGTFQSPSTLLVTNATLVSVAVSPSGADFVNGTTQKFSLIGTFSDGSTQDLSSAANWQSSNPAVATISNTGLATGTGVGTVQLSGTFDGQTATTSPSQVTSANLVSIAIQPSSASFANGTSQQFTVIGTFSDGTTEDLTSSAAFQSSNPAVVNISSTGLGQGVGTGSAQITVTADGQTVTTGTVQVTPATLVSISITPSNPHFASGTTQQFLATGTFSDGTTQNLTSLVTWSSSMPSVATINQSGVAESDMTGATQFSARYQGVTGTTGTIQVTQTTLVSFTISPTSATIAKGTAQQFTATGTFSDGSTEDLTSQVSWTSSNGNVLTINSAGLATGVGSGSAQVSATYGGQTNTTNAIQVTVATLMSVAVTPASASLPNGSTLQYTLTGTFSDGSTQKLSSSATWSSSNSAVAGINASGLATSASVGSTTITGQSGSFTATAQLTVSAATLTSVSVSPTSGSIPQGTTQQFTATGTYSDGSTQSLSSSVTWISSNPGVLSIDTNGLGTADGQTGGVTITVQSSSGATYTSFNFGVTGAVLASITVHPQSASIAVGATQQFTATGTFTNGQTEDVSSGATWTSSVPRVATVNSSGLATANAAGSASIQAAFSGLTNSAALTVTATAATAQGLVVSPSTASIAKGTDQQFTAAVQYSDGSTTDVTSQTTWQSLAPSVATINSSGLAMASGPGNTQITGTYGGFSGTASLQVSAATLSLIAVTPSTASMANGTAQQFTATGTLSDGSTENLSSSVTWSSSNTADATINAAGLATGQSPGQVTITAQSGSTQGTAMLTVTNATASSLQVQPSSVSMSSSSTQQLLVTATFSDGTSQNVTQSATYASSNTSIAAVSAGGLVQGVSTGNATVTVSLGSASTTVPVTITGVTLRSISVTPQGGTGSTADTLTSGEGQQLAATGTYSDGTTQDLTSRVTWSSSAPSTVSVNSTGYATAVQAGNATVTAQLNSVSGTLPITVSSASATSISVTPSTATLAAGQTQQYAAVATMSDGSQQTVTNSVHWSVSPSSTATISNTSGQNGLLTSSAAGTATVTAALGSTTGTAALTVTSATLTGLTVSPATFNLAAGVQQQLTVTGTYSDGSSQNVTATAVYASQAQNVATVSSSALVTATGTGTAGINATVGTTTAEAVAIVVPGTLVSIAVTPATPTVADGLNEQFTATGTYTNLSQANITNQVQWTSSNTAAAIINGGTGLAKAVGAGTATINASSGTTTGSTTMTVSTATLESISVQAAQTSFALGQSLQLHAIGSYSDGSTQDLTSSVIWTSLNTAIGVVGNTGVASGIKAGVFGAQATLNGLTASIPIMVTNAVLQSITVTPANTTIVDTLGNATQFTATGHFSDGTTQVLSSGVHWSISAPVYVGSISQSGSLSAVAAGTGNVVVTYGTITGQTGFVVVAI